MGFIEGKRLYQKIAYGRSVVEKVKGSRDEYKRVRADDYMVMNGIRRKAWIMSMFYQVFSNVRICMTIYQSGRA